MSHDFYIFLSYAITFGLIGVAALWTWLDGRARQRELQALDAAGIRRRSAQPAGDEGEQR
ncbi:heme exporter protein CcmD [Ciceribacter sp. L1K22]|uniref:heme exporter protein CcmD n=1 Tax=Ciceribacter sp. L1K22 TaxID=2820275 RepID=UPI001ABE5939|nr:heme exporter protein CcmD [Ciceribacter sp. L1K22]MBO3758235.1 heme exporter protein CcmD [Ciceribacter sp. L1K22]